MRFSVKILALICLTTMSVNLHAETETTEDAKSSITDTTDNPSIGKHNIGEAHLKDHSMSSSPGKGVKGHDLTKHQMESEVIPRDLPHLHIIGKEDKFYVGIGGTVKGTASFDFGHVLDNPDEFIVSAIPMQQPKGDGGKFQASAQQTELYMIAGINPGKNMK